MTPGAQIGIIGYGAIGRDLCDRLGREGHRVVLLLRAGSASREIVPPGLPVVDTVEALIALRPQLVVEAAGQAVLDQTAESILRAGVSLIAASTGALAEAARLYPRNLNAGLTVALAVAPAPVTVRVIADPAVRLNTHEIEAESALGAAFMRFANRPSPDNPKTSALTAASLAATVRRLLEPVMR